MRPILKRALDIGLSFVALFLSSPLMALIAILVKLDSRGPVLSHEQPIGEGHMFVLKKFRSMFFTPIRV
jgi:lipopolysaccharide/colanic/teichoic acid biosynthesis glycosyltransferase